MIHEDCYCNRRYAAATSLTAGGLAAPSRRRLGYEASLAHFSSRMLKKVRQLCSRIAQRLNVPKRTPRFFARCGLAGRPFWASWEPFLRHHYSQGHSEFWAETEFFRSLL